MSHSLMFEGASFAIAILTTLGIYTASVVGLVLWLTSKFRSLEVLIYKEMNSLKDEHRGDIQDLRDRVYRLELAEWGVTKIP